MLEALAMGCADVKLSELLQEAVGELECLAKIRLLGTSHPKSNNCMELRVLED